MDGAGIGDTPWSAVELHELPAEPEAVAADAGRVSRQDLPRPVLALAAEAAPWPPATGRPGTGGRAPTELTLRLFDAAIADVDVRPGHQLVDFTGWTAAPGTNRIALRAARPPHLAPPGPAGAIDDLLNPLMAQTQRLGDLAQ